MKTQHLSAIKFAEFYDQLLTDEAAIQRINLLRPRIYIYTDFGGGQNQNSCLVDAQTSGEICSLAWKNTLQQELYINDSAKPLSPLDAAFYLAKTFPYQGAQDTLIRTIVIHVIDPGVGNNQQTQPRALVLRKDGVLFIGPDNGTLSFACPQGSIAGIWEIDSAAVTALSGINTKVGGTFHGRDIFSEAAFRIAAGIVLPHDMGIPYETVELIHRTPFLPKHQETLASIAPLTFECVRTDRFFYETHFLEDRDLFSLTFLLGVIQSSLYAENVALTHAKKLFLPKEKPSSDLIGIINYKNGNIFIGPNNGLGTAFFKGFSQGDVEVIQVTPEVFATTCQEPNNEAVFQLLKTQPSLKDEVIEVCFLGEPQDYDLYQRPKSVEAKIWVDLYGNMKTSISSTLLDTIKQLKAHVTVVVNGIKKSIVFADTFSEVPQGELFLYNGSTGQIGPNPDRSKRYVELTANGIFGQFGIDFFEKSGTKPRSGDSIWLYFDYTKKI